MAVLNLPIVPHKPYTNYMSVCFTILLCFSSGFLALVVGGERKRWILATDNMKPGDIIQSTREIPPIPSKPISLLSSLICSHSGKNDLCTSSCSFEAFRFHMCAPGLIIDRNALTTTRGTTFTFCRWACYLNTRRVDIIS